MSEGAVCAGARVELPLSVELVRKLHAGDVVYLDGLVCTARDEAHLKALENPQRVPVNFERGAVYHCGPLMQKTTGGWRVIAAGPTTSARMNALEPKFIARFKLACIIGKGGMDARTKEALQKHACCYLAFPGGAAVLAAARIKAVRSVHWLEELGMPEALWVLEVENFGPLVVAMDCHGVSLYETVEREVAKNLPRVEALLGL